MHTIQRLRNCTNIIAINRLYLSYFYHTIRKTGEKEMIEDTAKTKNLKSSNPTIKIASDKEIQKISKKIIARNKDLYIALAK